MRWEFPEIGVPPIIIHFHAIFPLKPSNNGGTPIYPQIDRDRQTERLTQGHKRWPPALPQAVFGARGTSSGSPWFTMGCPAGSMWKIWETDGNESSSIMIIMDVG